MYRSERTDGYFKSPEDAPPSRLAMMRAYIDESGHEGRGYVVVAGFFGDEKAWEAFEPKWRAALVINVLRGVPNTERIEFVFEEQREYAPAVDNVMAFASMKDMAYKVTKDGKPKIAKWGFVPKGSTVMTDPADYLAFATREHCTNPNMKKAKWTRAILEAGDGQAFGRIKTSRALFKRLYERA